MSLAVECALKPMRQFFRNSRTYVQLVPAVNSQQRNRRNHHVSTQCGNSAAHRFLSFAGHYPCAASIGAAKRGGPGGGHFTAITTDPRERSKRSHRANQR